MPKKSHRVAASQARLSQRRRRGRGGRPQVTEGSPELGQEDQDSARAEASLATEPRVEPRTLPTSAVKQKTQAVPQAAYAHLLTELKQIGIVTGLVLVILVVLTVLLR